MKKIPVSVLVLCCIGIALACLNFLSMAAGAFFIFVDLGGPNPARDALRNDSLQMAYFYVSLCTNLILATLLITCSIGSIKLRRWAWKGMLIYAWSELADTGAGLVFQIVHAIPRTLATLPAERSLRTITLIGVVASVVAPILWAVFPVCVLYFFSRKHVKEAFSGAGSTATLAFPPEFPSAEP
jgi:hypothetical protein